MSKLHFADCAIFEFICSYIFLLLFVPIIIHCSWKNKAVFLWYLWEQDTLAEKGSASIFRGVPFWRKMPVRNSPTLSDLIILTLYSCSLLIPFPRIIEACHSSSRTSDYHSSNSNDLVPIGDTPLYRDPYSDTNSDPHVDQQASSFSLVSAQ